MLRSPLRPWSQRNQGGCCGHLLREDVPLRNGPKKESLLLVGCSVRWNVVGEVVRMSGGSPRVIGWCRTVFGLGVDGGSLEAGYQKWRLGMRCKQ